MFKFATSPAGNTYEFKGVANGLATLRDPEFGGLLVKEFMTMSVTGWKFHD